MSIDNKYGFIVKERLEITTQAELALLPAAEYLTLSGSEINKLI